MCLGEILNKKNLNKKKPTQCWNNILKHSKFIPCERKGDCGQLNYLQMYIIQFLHNTSQKLQWRWLVYNAKFHFIWSIFGFREIKLRRRASWTNFPIKVHMDEGWEMREGHEARGGGGKERWIQRKEHHSPDRQQALKPHCRFWHPLALSAWGPAEPQRNSS